MHHFKSAYFRFGEKMLSESPSYKICGFSASSVAPLYLTSAHFVTYGATFSELFLTHATASVAAFLLI